MESLHASQILDKIIEKGGLIGNAAKCYSADPIKTNQFIRECSEQCHNKTAIDYWGKELVHEIQNYVKHHG